MRAYSIKYALTLGIQEVAIEPDGDRARVLVVRGAGNLVMTYLPMKFFEPTMKAAIVSAEKMRDARIASLRRQIVRLDALRFQ